MRCVCDRKSCTSCTACVQHCPRNNLLVAKKLSGFNYVVPKKECSWCSFVCPQLEKVEKNEIPTAYALQLKNKTELVKSTSGGAFVAIAMYVFRHGGIVYGAIYDENMRVVHSKASRVEDISEMLGSKYVLSDISKVYKDLSHELANNKLCFFVGLPCQVAGVLSYVGEKRQNLITADLVCTGVPSPKLFNAYIKNLEKHERKKVVDYKFRDKREYGLSHTTVIDFEDKRGHIFRKTIPNRNNISYYVAFGKYNCYMETCYNCKYNTVNRISDFTLGGFWNIVNCNSKLSEYDGISLVLASTDKAKSVIEWSKSIADIELHSLEESIKLNPGIIEQTSSRLYRKLLYLSLKILGYRITSWIYFCPHNSKVYKVQERVRYYKNRIKRVIIIVLVRFKSFIRR